MPVIPARVVHSAARRGRARDGRPRGVRDVVELREVERAEVSEMCELVGVHVGACAADDEELVLRGQDRESHYGVWLHERVSLCLDSKDIEKRKTVNSPMPDNRGAECTPSQSRHRHLGS